MSNKDMPAYPVPASNMQSLGLTKLEAFTMAALQGLCSADPSWQNIDETASKAAAIAEAALAELEGRDGQ